MVKRAVPLAHRWVQGGEVFACVGHGNRNGFRSGFRYRRSLERLERAWEKDSLGDVGHGDGFPRQLALLDLPDAWDV